jgi:Holliday junction DNA helicase RuvA
VYEYITGLVTIVTPQYVVVEAGGVGYQLLVANPYRYQVDETQRVRIYVYQAVRDDSITLFGFVDQAEKRLFLQLINVSGIGPKSALAILANPDHQGLIDAIANNNVGYLTKFPGIGKKTASQIVLDLKDKIADQATGSLLTADQPTAASTNPALDDALAALSALGYREREIKKIKKQLLESEATTTDEYLRQALRLIN